MELVTQEDLLDQCFKDLLEINDELNSNDELVKFITSADNTAAEKKAKLQEIFGNGETILRKRGYWILKAVRTDTDIDK